MFTLKAVVQPHPNTRRKRAAREPQKITKRRPESKILAFA